MAKWIPVNAVLYYRKIATSKFQPTYARQAYPCFDEPGFKSTFKVRLVRPRDGYIALSNMEHVVSVNTTRQCWPVVLSRVTLLTPRDNAKNTRTYAEEVHNDKYSVCLRHTTVTPHARIPVPQWLPILHFAKQLLYFGVGSGPEGVARIWNLLTSSHQNVGWISVLLWL
jgi:hypothetical protein